jgi:glycosyltransferase involved in cell wall biosynthesis
MRIAIDGNFILSSGSKKPTTAELLMYSLLKNRDNHEYFLVTDGYIDTSLQWLSGITCHVLKPLGGFFRSRKVWYDFQLPSYLSKNKIDIFLGLSGIISLKCNVKQVLWLQDVLDSLSDTQEKSIGKSLFLRRLSIMINASDKIVVPAAGVLPVGIENSMYIAKTLVLPVGPFQPENAQMALSAKALDSLNPDISALVFSGMPYFLCIEGWQKTSDAVALLLAFSAFKKRMETGMKLVLAGNGPREKGFMEKLSTFAYRKDVLVLTHISNEHLSRVFSSAYCLIHLPSSPEFFHLLQALHNQVPVITTPNFAYKGMLNDCVLFSTSEPGESLAQQMMLMYKDENRRSVLINKGYALSKMMTPEEVAKKLLFLLESED